VIGALRQAAECHSLGNQGRIAVHSEGVNRTVKLFLAPFISAVFLLLAVGGSRRGLGRGKASLLPVLLVLVAIGAYWVFRYVQKCKAGLAYGRSEVWLCFALDGYSRQTGHLPHDVRGLSWRVEMLRDDGDADDAALYKKFRLDEPWDGPHNKLLIAQIPSGLQDPEGKKGQTCYRGVRGKDCAFDDGKEVKAPAQGEPKILAVVITKESCPWTKPADAPVADVENGRCLRWFKGDGYWTRADAGEDGQARGITTAGSSTGLRRSKLPLKGWLRFGDAAK
jgi:hypothetical protein